MTLIDMAQKALNSKFNQRVAAARKIQVACAADQVPGELAALVESWNAEADARFKQAYEKLGKWQKKITSDFPTTRHYGLNERFVTGKPATLMVVYGFRASRLDEGAKKFDMSASHGWVSLLGIHPLDSGSVLHVQLQKWTVNQQGLLWNGDKYVDLLDGVVASLDGRYLTDPINDEDRRFVRKAI